MYKNRIGFKMLKHQIIGLVADKKLSRQITIDDKKRKSRRSIFEVRIPENEYRRRFGTEGKSVS